LARHTTTKRPVFAYRVKTIDDRHDSRGNGNLLAFKSVGIAAAIPLFMMMAYDRHDRIRKIYAAQNLSAHGCVDLHLFELGGSKSPGLVQDVIRNRQLADVVKQRACFEGGNLGVRESQHLSHPGRVNFYAPNVAM